jgi:hypothetical protein
VLKTVENSHEVITTDDGHEWTKQLSGSSCNSGWTPATAGSAMNDLMPDGYSFTKAEWCHKAQERLRQKMGCK